MIQPLLYRVFADLILAAHVLFVLFVVVGLVLIVVGGVRGWAWVRHPWFRLAHLAAIVFVAAQAWFGEICPLTTWEMDLRDRAGEATYAGGFIEYWLQTLLYYEAPAWVFTTAYTLFALLVVGSWIRVRPTPLLRHRTR